MHAGVIKAFARNKYNPCFPLSPPALFLLRAPFVCNPADQLGYIYIQSSIAFVVLFPMLSFSFFVINKSSDLSLETWAKQFMRHFNIDKLSRMRTWEWYLKAWVPVAYYKYDALSHFKSSSVQQLKDRERISMETNKRVQYSFLLVMITQCLRQ